MTAGEKAELFNQLHRIYKEDNAFFHAIADKLELVSVWSFQREIERRQDIYDHTPHEVTYVIYDNDDYGRVIGEPRGTAVVTTTGDPKADEATAIKRYLAVIAGKPEDEVMGVGFYTGMCYDTYADRRDEHLKDLRNKLAEAEAAAVYIG